MAAAVRDQRRCQSQIQAQLSALGIRRSNIFPDPDNLAFELKGAQFGQSPENAT
jgi:hypothetical protein